MPVGDDESTKAAKALALPTRSAILAHLLKAGALSAREVAEAFDLHPNVARAHLDLLVEAGFLATRVKRQGKGRPAKIYFTWEGEMAALEDWEVSPPGDETAEEPAPPPQQSPNPYRLISSILVKLVERFDPDQVYPIAEKVAKDEGRKLMLDYRGGGLDFAAAVRAMVDEFRRFSPLSSIATLEHDYAEIVVPDCPFRDIALEHADLVLILDPALKEGAMAALGHPSDVEIESSVARGDAECRMVIRRRSRSKSSSKKSKKGAN